MRIRLSNFSLPSNSYTPDHVTLLVHPLKIREGLATIELGAGTKIRTRDLLITNQLLYQLSYTGNKKRGGVF